MKTSEKKTFDGPRVRGVLRFLSRYVHCCQGAVVVKKERVVKGERVSCLSCRSEKSMCVKLGGNRVSLLFDSALPREKKRTAQG